MSVLKSEQSVVIKRYGSKSKISARNRVCDAHVYKGRDERRVFYFDRSVRTARKSQYSTFRIRFTDGRGID